MRRFDNEGRETMVDQDRGPTGAAQQDWAEKADRALRELRRYQHCLELSPTAREFFENNKDAVNDDMPLPPWATQMELLSPLCIAYDDRIRELEQVADERGRQLGQVMDQLKSVVT